jgi:hypothetical protein
MLVVVACVDCAGVALLVATGDGSWLASACLAGFGILFGRDLVMLSAMPRRAPRSVTADLPSCLFGRPRDAEADQDALRPPPALLAFAAVLCALILGFVFTGWLILFFLALGLTPLFVFLIRISRPFVVRDAQLERMEGR